MKVWNHNEQNVSYEPSTDLYFLLEDQYMELLEVLMMRESDNLKPTKRLYEMERAMNALLKLITEEDIEEQVVDNEEIM